MSSLQVVFAFIDNRHFGSMNFQFMERNQLSVKHFYFKFVRCSTPLINSLGLKSRTLYSRFEVRIWKYPN